MAAMLVRSGNVLFWVGIEGLLAAGGTEVIRLSFVLGLAGRSLGVYIHTANGIFCHFYLLVIKLQNSP
jgi:hypothetical protein